jgi:hypothetical protein
VWQGQVVEGAAAVGGADRRWGKQSGTLKADEDHHLLCWCWAGRADASTGENCPCLLVLWCGKAVIGKRRHQQSTGPTSALDQPAGGQLLACESPPWMPPGCPLPGGAGGGMSFGP